MLTIKTSIIHKGSFREKLWNVLDKIYNPYKIGFVSRWSSRQKDLTEANEAPFATLEVYKDRYDSQIIVDKLPDIKTQIDSSTKKETLYFEYPSYFTPEGHEDNPQYLNSYPAIDNRVHYVYLWQHVNEETGSMEVNSIAYFKKKNKTDRDVCIENGIAHFQPTGWTIVDEYIGDNEKVCANVIFDKEIKKECDSLKKKINFFTSIGHGIYKFMHTIDSTILCIRFPFLYTRNRWNGRHYNYWKLLNYIDKIKKKSVAFVSIRINKDETIPVFETLPDIRKRTIFKNSFTEQFEYFVDYQESQYTVCGKNENFMIGIQKEDGVAYYVYHKDTEQWLDVTDRLEKRDGELNFDHGTYKVLHRTIILDRKKKFYADFLNFIHNYILGIIFCIPTSNELDAMDEGWRRAFGIQMCKDVRKCLVKNSGFIFLFKYRITQIKEKFGGLRWYDNGSPRELYEIINKYENISFHTCICCGKPAKYITSGWICPYCEDCISESGKEGATVIDENGNEHSPRENIEEQCATETNTEESNESKQGSI